jgi:hypothetical protein
MAALSVPRIEPKADFGSRKITKRRVQQRRKRVDTRDAVVARERVPNIERKVSRGEAVR